jgi:hypothetical protein
MGVKLISASGGSVEINPPATASNFTATMPAGTGSVVVNGVNGSLVSATAVASTSGTSIDFTGIPSWVKRITVMFSNVSTNGSSSILLRIGSGGVTTTGYVSAVSYCGLSQGTASSTAGFAIAVTGAGQAWSGSLVINLLNASSYLYNESGVLSDSANYSGMSGGYVTLSGTLDRVRITTVNGTDTFDAGSINIMYE